MEWIFEVNKVKLVDESGKEVAKANLATCPNGDVDIEHVFVDPSLRGQGMATITMEKVVEYLRSNHKKAIASCSYANAWLHSHKELCQDIISKEFGLSSACKIDREH